VYKTGKCPGAVPHEMLQGTLAPADSYHTLHKTYYGHGELNMDLGLLFVLGDEHQQGISMHLLTFLTQSCGYQHCPVHQAAPLMLVLH